MENTSHGFWHRRQWKWALVVVLLSLAVAIWKWPAPAAKIKLLPFTDSPPAWDGSYPYLVIAPVDGSSPLKFTSQIVMRAPTVRHDAPVNEFAVDLHTGRFILRQTDLFVADVMPLALDRTYIAWDAHPRAFGTGTNHPYDICPTGTRFPYTYTNLNLEDGSQVYMPRASEGTGYADAAFRHSQTSSEFYGAMIAWNGNGWTMTFRDGRKIYFPEAYYSKTCAQGAPTEMDDGRGHRLMLKRSKTRTLEELISPSGRAITLQHDMGERIIEAADDAGHVRKYSYGFGGHLETVSDGSGILYRLEYAPLVNDAGFDPWLLTSVFDGKGNVVLHNRYLAGKVSEQALSDGEIFRYDYQANNGVVVETVVTFPGGEKKSFSFRDGIPVDQK